ncbi:P-loop containing nucleoside triphosphate hydrolase protein [Pestalotiopsis sp. NC0098]|nr:P-loop containing nucleoside triphosphate hydrolase protein [Pestalotiopsis sp. NC0098]
MGPGDILIFMPGEQEIQRARGMLAAASSALKVIPLHGSLSKRAQDRIYEPSEQRRCIISTNIAETSLTIKNVVYIIDSSLVKEMFSAKQRKGRAGRVSDGVCFRLYTKETFENDFRASIVPAIQMGRLESVILSLLCAGHKDLLSVDSLIVQ